MNQRTDGLLTDLRDVVGQLGCDGGLSSPSIYDTAQALRLAPPAGQPLPALEWLAQQQQADGGWGDPAIPRARDVSTLATILALHAYQAGPCAEAIRAGLAFLQRQAGHWAELDDNLPVGVELLFPQMLAKAAQAGLHLPAEPYAQLVALGQRRRRLIAGRAWPAGTPPVHSWEAWGSEPSPTLIDGSGGVGHSAAATAAWIQRAAGRPELAEHIAGAHTYLARGAAMTGVDLAGVVPGVWPISWFELTFGLYMLEAGGLLHHPALQAAVGDRITLLRQALRPEGIGFSDYFAPDGDDTAAALVILRRAGYAVDSAPLRAFMVDDHYCAFPGELQPSLSMVAHAAHALRLLGNDAGKSCHYLLARQQSDGRWPGDKWQSSWLYTTSQVLIALPHPPFRPQIDRAIEAIVRGQHPAGGWGQPPNAEETAYAVLALRHIRRQSGLGDAGAQALAAAERWLLDQHRIPRQHAPQLWLDKDAYRPHRIVRIVELAATLPEWNGG